MFRRSLFAFQSRKFTAAAATSGSASNVTYPSFEYSRVADKPEDGFMIRWTYAKDRGMVTFSRTPQLGHRKEEPDDPVPQFDVSRRVVARFTVPEAASILAVIGQQLPSVNIQSDNLKVVVHRVDSSLSIKGEVEVGPKSDRSKLPIDVQVDLLRMAQLYHFLDGTVKHKIGF